RSDPRYRMLVEAAHSVIDGTSFRVPTHLQAPGGISRRPVIAGGTVAVVASLSAVGWLALKPGVTKKSDSIAVLPFTNLSGDPSQAYFSDGIAEELRNGLVTISGLKVAGRTSSEVVRNDDAKIAAEKLGVSNILIGSVRRSPSMIRVSVQLIDGRSGLARWSE